MALGRYVLRYLGDGPKPPADVSRARQAPGVTVVDESPKMLLIEGDDASLAGLAEAFPGWAVTPEQTYSIPDARKRLGGPPD